MTSPIESVGSIFSVYTVKNRVLHWLFKFNTHRGVTENVEIHMTIDVRCKHDSELKTIIGSDINFRLHPVSEKSLVII